MNAKKNPRLNPEKDRKVYMNLGLFITASVVLMAFTWRHPIYEGKKEYFEEREGKDEIVYVAKEEQPKPVEQPKVEPITPPVTPPDNTTQANVLTPDAPEADNRNTEEKVGVSIDPVGPVVVVDPGLDEKPELETHNFVDVEAHLPNWIDHLRSNLEYPETPRYLGIEGQVVLNFVVEKDGTISEIKVLKSPDRELTKEAIRVVKASPRWTPGTIKGEYVRSYRTVAINFKLR
jgi:protein TonB